LAVQKLEDKDGRVSLKPASDLKAYVIYRIPEIKEG